MTNEEQPQWMLAAVLCLLLTVPAVTDVPQTGTGLKAKPASLSDAGFSRYLA